MSDKRNYNVFFHLHTVSGITITVGLFIIFFAGAFRLFRSEIAAWEKSGVTKLEIETSKTDYNTIVSAVEKQVPKPFGREIYAYQEPNSNEYSLYVSASPDSTYKEEQGNKDYRFKYNSAKQKLEASAENYSFGELLYWLHFYYQLDRIGYYISGFVAFFFFFAIITGVIVHWKKMFSNFFVFRPKQKLKTVWTDAHTALGFIGLPFQFIYALTGSMFGLGILVAVSNGLWVYDGNSEKMYADVGRKEQSAELGKPFKKTVDYNSLASKTEKQWDNFELSGFQITNYGGEGMQIKFWGEEHISSRFLGEGSLVFDAEGKQVAVKAPGDQNYYDNVWSTVRRLHYAQFGKIGSIGTYLVKIVYFILALITCFVIISGVLIWMEARNKKNVSERRKKYNNRVGKVYMSICLSMLPVTAAIFILAKVLPSSMNASRESIFNYTFFLGWLFISIIYLFFKSNYAINRVTLLFTGIFGLAIPILNGIFSHSWFWTNYGNRAYGVFSIDIIWLLIGLVCLLVFTRLKPRVSL